VVVGSGDDDASVTFDGHPVPTGSAVVVVPDVIKQTEAEAVAHGRMLPGTLRPITMQLPGWKLLVSVYGYQTTSSVVARTHPLAMAISISIQSASDVTTRRARRDPTEFGIAIRQITNSPTHG
jgi:hypothetical protein